MLFRSGLDFQNQGSSWTWETKDIPYISFANSSPKSVVSMFGAMIFNYPISFYSQYETAIRNTENSSESFIKTSNIAGDTKECMEYYGVIK